MRINERKEDMNKRIAFIMLLLLFAIGAGAQTGLAVNTVFQGRVVPGNRMVVTQVRGRSLSKYQLSFYHSLRFQANDKELERVQELFAQDQRQAVETYATTHGKKRSKTIIALPAKDRRHRFLCLSMSGRGVTMVYMEGSVASLSELRKLLDNQ